MGVGAPAGVFAAALVFLLAASGAPTAVAQDVWMWNVADIQQYMQVSPPTGLPLVQLLLQCTARARLVPERSHHTHDQVVLICTPAIFAAFAEGGHV
jgi:hypothetical protein